MTGTYIYQKITKEKKKKKAIKICTYFICSVEHTDSFVFASSQCSRTEPVIRVGLRSSLLELLLKRSLSEARGAVQNLSAEEETRVR